MAKERENFYKNSTLIVDHTKNSLIDLLELHLTRLGVSLENFINTHQHEIYHLCYNTRRCCQCTPGYMLPPHRVLYPSQLELLLDKFGAALPCHVPGRRADFCCCQAKPRVTTGVLDITLTRTLLINFCADVFWYSCVTLQSITLEDFLNLHQHDLYHLMDYNRPCCQCTPGYVFPATKALLKPPHWNLLFNNLALPCVLHRMVPSSNICCVSASSSIVTSHLGNELASIILEHCCSLRKVVYKLVQMRNNVYGHATEGSISDTDYKTYKTELESGILEIAKVCGKETEIRQILQDHEKRPLDETLCIQYQNTMLEQILKEKSLEQKVDELTTQLPKTVETVVKQVLNADSKLTEDQRKRKDQFKEITHNQIMRHISENTFVETHLVPYSLDKLEQNGIVILTGTAGIGKSRNSLELLRRYCTEHKGYYAVSLPRISEWSGLISADEQVVVWIDDAFGRTNTTYMDDDSKYLDIILATLSKGTVKLILTMRSTIKSLLTGLTDCHQIFKQTNFIDLCSEDLLMNVEEREQCLLNHCKKNNIWKSGIRDDNHPSCEVTTLDISVPVYLDWMDVYHIVRTDLCPLLGFPQACYLFASNRKFTRQGVVFFKHPTQTLCDEINDLRSLGKKDENKALEYAVLVHIVLDGDKLELGRINCRKIEHLLRSIYGLSKSKNTPMKIKDCVTRLTGRYLKIKGDNSASFQHRSIFESVLLSYKDVNPSLMMTCLDLDSLLELCCLENYAPHMGEVIFKIYSEDYKLLAGKLVSNLKNASSPNGFMKKLCASKIIRNGNARFLEEFYNVYVNSKLDLHIRMGLLCSSESEIDFWWSNQMFDYGVIKPEPKIVFTFLESLLRFSSDYRDNTTVFVHLLNLICKNVDNQNAVYVKDRYTECLTMCLLKACASKDSERLSALSEFIDKMHMNLDLKVMSSYFRGRKNDEAFILKILVSSLKEPNVSDIRAIVDKAVALDNIEVLEFILDYYDSIDVKLSLNTACKEEAVKVFDWFCSHYSTEIDDVNSLLLTLCENGKAEIVKILLRRFDHALFSLDAAVNKAINNVDIGLRDNCYLNIVYVLLTQCKHSFNVMEIMNIVLRHCVNRFSRRKLNMGDHCILVRYLLQTYDITKFDLNSVVEIAGLSRDSSILELLLQKIDVSTFWGAWISAKHFENHRNLALQHIIKSGHSIDNDVQTLIEIEIEERNVDNIKVILETFDWGLFDINSVIDFGCSDRPDFILWIFDKFGFESVGISNILDMALRRQEWKIVKWLLENIDNHPFDMNEIIKHASRCRSIDMFNWLLNTFDHKLFNLRSIMDSACKGNSIKVVKVMIDMFGVGMFDMNVDVEFALRNIREGCTDIVQTILRKNNYSENFNMIMIFNSACYSNQTMFVKWLLQRFRPNNFHFHLAIKETVKGAKNSKKSSKFDTLKFLLSHLDHILLDVASITQNLCENDEYDMVEWTLDRFDLSLFDLNFIMNKACQQGTVYLVQRLFDKCKHNRLNMESVFQNACKNKTCDVIAWLFDSFDHRKYCFKDATNYSFRNIMFLIENCEHNLLDFNNILNYLSKKLGEEIYMYMEFVRCLLEIIDNKHFDVKLVFNQVCRYGTISFLEWIMNTIEHRLLDFKSAVFEALRNKDIELVIFILESKAKELDTFDVNSIFNQACQHNRSNVVDWLLNHFDIQRFDVYDAIDKLCSHILCEELIQKIMAKLDTDRTDFNLILKSACRGYTSISFKRWLMEASDSSMINPQSIVQETCNRTHPEWEFVELMLSIHDYKSFDMKLILDRACQTNSSEIVSWLLNNFDQALYDLESAFNKACSANHVNVLKCLVDSVGKGHLNLQSAISISLNDKYRSGDVIKYLFTIIPPSTSELQLVLDKFFVNFDTNILKWLLESFDCSALDVKRSLGKISTEWHIYEWILKLLLGNFDHEKFDMTTIIIRACSNHYPSHFRLWLLKTVDHSLFNLRKIMLEICKIDDVAAMEYLIVTCRYLDVIDEDFILTAITTGNSDVIIWLLQKFQDTKLEITIAMNNACISGNTRFVQWLLMNHGTKCFDLRSAMNSACRYGRLDTVQYFLQILHYETFDMETAMNQACEHGHLEITRWFLAVYDSELFNVDTAISVAIQNEKHVVS